VIKQKRKLKKPTGIGKHAKVVNSVNNKHYDFIYTLSTRNSSFIPKLSIEDLNLSFAYT